MSTDFPSSRRSFLAGAAAVVAVTLAPGVTLYARHAGEPASGKVRWGMLIDASKCDADCDSCIAACNTEIGIAPGASPETTAHWIRKVSVTDRQTGAVQSVPVMCQHCEHPPCVDVCPTGASFRRADGIVLVNRHICIGCRYCMLACPYKARSFVHESVVDQKPHAPRGKGTAEACTMCVHRIDAGGIPACAEACAAADRNAILFGDLNDPDSEIAKRVASFATTQLRDDLQTNPGIRYQGV